MNATLNRNGQQRKSLAGQLDRFDTLLDGLADGLNEAVAAAVQAAVSLAVQEAVRAVLSEVLQNADLLAQLRPAQPTPPASPVATPTQPRWRWLRAGCQRLGRTLSACQKASAGAVQAAGQAVRDGLDRCVQHGRRTCTAAAQHGRRWAAGGRQLCHLMRLFPGPLLTGLVIGVATAVAVYHAGPWLSAVVAGLGGFLLSSLAHLGVRLRWLLPLLPDWLP